MWSDRLLPTKFFNPCSRHMDARKNEVNKWIVRTVPTCSLCLDPVSHILRDISGLRVGKLLKTSRTLERPQLSLLCSVHTFVRNVA